MTGRTTYRGPGVGDVIGNVNRGATPGLPESADGQRPMGKRGAAVPRPACIVSFRWPRSLANAPLARARIKDTRRPRDSLGNGSLSVGFSTALDHGSTGGEVEGSNERHADF